VLIEMFQQHRFDLTLALQRRQLFDRNGVIPADLLRRENFCRRDAGRPWLKPLGSGRFGKYSCLCFGFVRPARSVNSVRSRDAVGAWPE